MGKRRNQLVAHREAKGSREKVAADLGISKIYLRMLETGAHKPGRDVMIRISNYLDQPVGVLFPDLFTDDPSNSLRPMR